MPGRVKTLLEFLVLILLIGLMLTGIEINYHYRRHTPTYVHWQSYYLLYRAKSAAQSGDLNQAVSELTQAAYLHYYDLQLRTHPNVAFEPPVAIPDIPAQASGFINQLQREMANLDYALLSPPYNRHLPYLYYRLGTLAYQNNLIELAEYFFRVAVNIAPDWSELHLELANFFLTRQQPDLAQHALQFCLHFEGPQQHCQDYLNINLQLDIQNQTSQPVGFLEPDITNYILNKKP